MGINDLYKIYLQHPSIKTDTRIKIIGISIIDTLHYIIFQYTKDIEDQIKESQTANFADILKYFKDDVMKNDHYIHFGQDKPFPHFVLNPYCQLEFCKWLKENGYVYHSNPGLSRNLIEHQSHRIGFIHKSFKITLKNKKVIIGSLANDAEAFDFGKKIKNYLATGRTKPKKGVIDK